MCVYIPYIYMYHTFMCDPPHLPKFGCNGVVFAEWENLEKCAFLALVCIRSIFSKGLISLDLKVTTVSSWWLDLPSLRKVETREFLLLWNFFRQLHTSGLEKMQKFHV